MMDPKPPQEFRQLRADLEFSPQQHQGKAFVIVKDPVTARYFRFTESQAAILELLRKPIDPAALSIEASERLNASIPQATIDTFLDSLKDKWLLDTVDIRDKLAAVKSHKLEGRNLLYWKLLSINPEKIFDWIEPRTHWAFTKAFHVFAVCSILIGFINSYQHWDAFKGGIHGLFNLHGLLFLWIVIFSVVTMHELAHGMTCRHFGGQVKEVGFMLMYFQPAFYCDVSDSWMFPSKRQRMWVTFAGGYFQLVIWSWCTILWRVTEPDSPFNQVALTVVVFAGLQTLFNFNPLIKLDGYYMLSDYLEIPNLRTKAMRSLWAWVAGRHPSPTPWREERSQMTYAVLSMLFSTSLLVYVYSYLYTWATTSYRFAGLVGFLMFSTYTLRRTAAESIAGLRAAFTRAISRKFITVAVAAAAALVMFIGHWELRIPAEFRVLARDEIVVRTETEGIIVDVLVREGSQVSKGDVLARLRDYSKQQRISDVLGNLKVKRNELELLVAGARPEELDRKQKLVDTKKIEFANARRNQEQRNQLEQTLARKQSELQLDRQQLERTRRLVTQGLSPRVDLEKAETAVHVREKEISEIEASIAVLIETSDREADLKLRELAEAESELQLVRAGNRPELIRQVRADVEKLVNEAALLEQELGKTEIRAPIDGIVATPFVERKLNQHLTAGGELIRIVDISHVTVEMQVPEKEMVDVRPGNPVKMKARRLASMELTGRVDFIAPVAQTVNGQQMVVVRSELQNESGMLKPDMTGFAKIECGDRRIFDILTRSLVHWYQTKLWDLLP